LISYDRVHNLFLHQLARLAAPEAEPILPEGETHPEVRGHISQILQELLTFTLGHSPPGTRILVEAPLIGQRGENLLAGGQPAEGQIQVIILHSPVLRSEVLRQQPARATSAQAPAMHQIRTHLLQERGIADQPDVELALQQSWESWLKDFDGCLLSLNPHHDPASFLYTRSALQARQMRSDPLYPENIFQHALYLIHQTISQHTHLKQLISLYTQVISL
jgi:hypothetical protein